MYVEYKPAERKVYLSPLIQSRVTTFEELFEITFEAETDAEAYRGYLAYREVPEIKEIIQGVFA